MTSSSFWEELLTGVPQCSVLGPLLFDIYLNDLFYAVEYADIFYLADDTTPHSSSIDINEAITNFEHDCNLLIEWFRGNCMTPNALGYHLLVSDFKDEVMCATVGSSFL